LLKVEKMLDLKEHVKNELKKECVSKKCLQLCDDVFKWYDDVGPYLIEEKISEKINEVRKKFRKGIKEIKETKVEELAKKRKKKAKRN